MTTLPTFTSPRERTIWVQGWLRLHGQSFASIARQHGWTRWSVAAAMTTASYPQECAIAAALGVTPETLFPERYDRDGKRLHLIRNPTPARAPDNVQSQEAA